MGFVMLELDQANALGALFARAGYSRVEPAVLQPVDVFLDLSGEDIRRHMFVTQDATGRELCLRPDYTIPVSRDYLASAEAGQQAAFSYLGPVFRLRAGTSGEFPQAGVESFGRGDQEAADAEIVALALEALASLGITQPVIRMGDVGLLTALLDKLDLAPPVRRRVLRAVVQGRLDGVLDGGDINGRNGQDHAGLLAAIEGQDPQAARAFVEDVMAIAGVTSVGGRSAGEIAERFLARASSRHARIDDGIRDILTRYLAISGDPDTAIGEIRSLTRDAGLDLDATLDQCEARTGFMAARGLDVGSFVFAADFARNLDYYTGLIFEAHDPSRPETKPIVGGGRYDGLLSHLGARAPIPAVGFAIWLDRLTGDASRSTSAGDRP
ncbi:ATP phosphoribosyltransferase regulatory subunit [Chelatococcus asaccharovorans]|nr:ATP phosphoribosyltransferase regulatory subunit [Chelatococcus asaccharovorans]CAH1679478.1 ATP phosphoribosyltransferase regulatory subunit [Chelatococcus asaccharovorans]